MQGLRRARQKAVSNSPPYFVRHGSEWRKQFKTTAAIRIAPARTVRPSVLNLPGKASYAREASNCPLYFIRLIPKGEYETVAEFLIYPCLLSASLSHLSRLICHLPLLSPSLHCSRALPPSLPSSLNYLFTLPLLLTPPTLHGAGPVPQGPPQGSPPSPQLCCCRLQRARGSTRRCPCRRQA